MFSLGSLDRLVLETVKQVCVGAVPLLQLGSGEIFDLFNSLLDCNRRVFSFSRFDEQDSSGDLIVDRI